jgi:hypothetical protein
MGPLVDALITMEMIDKIGIFCPSMNTQYNQGVISNEQNIDNAMTKN